MLVFSNWLWIWTGFGSFLGTLLRPILSVAWKAIVPVLTHTAKAVGREALSTGGNILTDIIAGEDPKTAAQNRWEVGARRMCRHTARGVRRVAKGAVKQIGKGGRKTRKRKKQKGKGKGRGRPKKKKHLSEASKG